LIIYRSKEVDFKEICKYVYSSKVFCPNAVGLNPDRDFGIFNVSTIQLANGTSVVLLRCPFVSEIMHGRAPEVFLHK
jgi:hypothetical protein